MLKLLFQSSRADILYLLVLDKFKGSIRAIAKSTGYSPMQTRNELLNLEKAGVVRSEEIGRSKIYSSDEKCPFIDELAALLTKTAGFELQIKQAIADILGIETAFIYGSYANGKFHAKSDIDLFIIGEPDMKRLNSAIFSVQRRIGREINMATYSRKEFEKRKMHGFIKNVLSNKRIMILGNEHGLG
jgi:predicted nucleotidyltransferase